MGRMLGGAVVYIYWAIQMGVGGWIRLEAPGHPDHHADASHTAE